MKHHVAHPKQPGHRIQVDRPNHFANTAIRMHMTRMQPEEGNCGAQDQCKSADPSANVRVKLIPLLGPD